MPWRYWRTITTRWSAVSAGQCSPIGRIEDVEVVPLTGSRGAPTMQLNEKTRQSYTTEASSVSQGEGFTAYEIIASTWLSEIARRLDDQQNAASVLRRCKPPYAAESTSLALRPPREAGQEAARPRRRPRSVRCSSPMPMFGFIRPLLSGLAHRATKPKRSCGVSSPVVAQERRISAAVSISPTGGPSGQIRQVRRSPRAPRRGTRGRRRRARAVTGHGAAAPPRGESKSLALFT